MAYYQHNSGVPAATSRGATAPVRAEFDLIAAAFTAVLADINLRLGSTPGAPSFTGPVTFGGTVAFSVTPTLPATSGANSTDAVNVAYLNSRIAQAATIGTYVYTPISGATNAVKNCRYGADTSAIAYSLTLPASPAVGDQIAIVKFGANVLTVVRNGNTINAIAEDMTISSPYGGCELIWTGTTWRVF
jgi:hypothetical protein